MANLNKTDRVAISSRLVNIEKELKAADQAIVDAAAAKVDATVKDEPNRKLLEEKDTFVNPYQNELEFFDGNLRTELSESLLVDSVNRTLNNSFFPNDPGSPLPSIPDGVWKNLVPFTKTHAIGKTNFEAYAGTRRTEQDILDDINTQIATMEAVIVPRRVTGIECAPGLPAYCIGEPGGAPFSTNQVACEGAANGGSGTWIPTGPDFYQADPIVVPGLTNLEALIQEWETMMNDEKNTIPVAIETDGTRISGNTNAIADIDAAIPVINAWQAIQDYDTTTNLPNYCIDFNNLIEAQLEQAKMSPTTLAPLKAEITARSAFIITREAALNSDDYLGSIGQDLNSGDLTSFAGLYGDRMLLIDLRLNTLAGTLNKKIGSDKIGVYQDSFKNSSKNAEAALSLALTAVRTVAPGINTNYLNLKDASGFSVGDRVFVVADKQEELSGSIEEITKNRVKLTFKTPKKYTMSNNTRLYKVL